MKAWRVFVDGNHVDTVWFMKRCNKQWVIRSLIKDDGFPTTIVVSA